MEPNDYDYEVLLVVAGLAQYTQSGFAMKPSADIGDGMGNKDGDMMTRDGRPGLQQWQQGHIATTLMVMTEGGSSTLQSATTRDEQAPKRKDMRSTAVGGGGGGVWHGVLVRRGGEEGVGRRAGGGCSSRHLIVLLCHQGKKLREGYEGGGREVLVVVSPVMGMGILRLCPPPLPTPPYSRYHSHLSLHCCLSATVRPWAPPSSNPCSGCLSPPRTCHRACRV